MGSATGPAPVAFGPFRLFTAQRLLLEGDQPIRLGSRALEILLVLIEQPGRLVGKDELLERVWPDIAVEEINLRVHVAALRRTLRDGMDGRRYLSTIPGRGYRFVAPIAPSDNPWLEPAVEPPAVQQAQHNLPAAVGRMVGRQDARQMLAGLLARHRLVSVAGPGGIGKTTLAVAVAAEVAADFRDGVRFVDLAPLADPALVPSAIAATLNVAVRSADPMPVLIDFLQQRKVLIVLDNCEHVADVAATVAVELLRGSPEVRILATSREPLRAEGEHVMRLPPLRIPAAVAGITAAEALQYPAVELFVERAAQAQEQFEITDADAPVIAAICRRLDGIALAIEIAAGRTDVFGVHGLAAVLDDRFRLMTRGRRTALPRQRTMSATLDWSYELLAPAERQTLRRLAIFSGEFSLEAAIAVTAPEAMSSAAFAEYLADLVTKSLVSAEIGDISVRYRLLETTRAYAMVKLGEAGEFDQLARRHADYLLELFGRASTEWETLPTDEWLEAYGGQIDGVRAALDWAFSPAGDAALAEALTIAAIPLWMHLSLMNECRSRIEQALGGHPNATDPDPRRNVQLHTALGLSLMFTRGAVPETAAALETARVIAESLGDTDEGLRAVWGLWVHRLNNGMFRDSLALAHRFSDLARSSRNPVDLTLADRMLGFSLHFLGDPAAARQHLERMLASYVPAGHRPHIIRFQFDQRVTAAVTRAEILWLLGFPDQAAQAMADSVADARAIEHAVSLCNTLAKACPVALFVGDLAAAEAYVTTLLQAAARYGLSFWQSEGKAFAGLVRVKRGDVQDGLRLLRSALDEPQMRSVLRYTALLGDFAGALFEAGDAAAAGTAIDAALARAERNEENWCLPELLRIKGVIEGSARILLDALEASRRQGALSWELRIATSLARIEAGQRDSGQAYKILKAVYERFTEGFTTPDLRLAGTLLATR
ncbi:MAG: winged helix-turn-helix domain-containing protein [Acetobacteraceae bacterium]